MAAKNKAGKTAIVALALMLSVTVLPASAAAETLVAGGRAVGIRMSTDGVVVAGVNAVETASGAVSPAGDAGLQVGDIIVRVGPAEIHTAQDFVAAAGRLTGEGVTVTATRRGETRQFTVTPVKDADGVLRLGLWLRSGVSGVGTVTFYDPATHVYGALGHGITDADTGDILPIGSGTLTDARIVGIVKGQSGTPGELSGCADENAVCGSIVMNTAYGIFGILDTAEEGLSGAMECGEPAVGDAVILTTLSDNTVGRYTVRIDRVYHDPSGDRIQLTVTDATLLAATGGIVQGMSGSPIVQNGKLVGAVTHVFVNDPTKGYGLNVQDMIDEVVAAAQKAA
ncbi:MAG TPA: SpoIVB peptidase S55 domain-containing protein [Oscillospiraceae bacterium]|nr:SpoIVB peptidase S55 domain-containing protein [Oscillospiraceae bacterium]